MAAIATAAPSTLKITATQGILAMKGSGKTYRAMAQAEDMLDRGAHVVAIDPTGAWWGLRYAASDTSKVLYPQLALLGGDKGSIDLLDSHGTVVARAVVEKKMSCVLDLSRMSKAGMRRFVAAFLLELFRTNPNRQIHLFIDEADLFAPQHAQGEAATVAGAMSDVVRRGRKKGIGVTMISQRPQALSTDVRKVDDLIKEAEQHETPDFAEDFVGERKVSQPRVVGTVQATPDFVGDTQVVTQSHEANELGNCEYRILSVLKRGTRDRESLAMLCVYSGTSGGFGAALAGLRKRDLIHGGPEGMFLTAAGQKAAPNDGWPLIRGSKLLEAWHPKLGKCENQILHALTTRGPMLREVLAKHTAYSPTSGGFGAALAVLRKLGLIKNEGKLLASNRLING